MAEVSIVRLEDLGYSPDLDLLKLKNKSTLKG
jgi:hypothetical protein